MKISKGSFFSIGSDLKIPKEQIKAFWTDLEKLDKESTPFARYLFYFGAMIVISAMTWFMNLGWELFGGGGIFLIATAYALIFTLMGSLLWNKKDLKIPAGLIITIAVCTIPLAIYGLENYFNLWPSDHHGQYNNFYYLLDGIGVFMELGTILAGIIALRFFPFPFLTFPIFLSAWYLTMDIVPFVFGKNLGWVQHCWISLFFGLVLIAIGFVIDCRKKEDFAFWSYLFGTLSFCGGLNCLVWNKGEFALFIYFIISLIMICLSILVRRNVLMIFGAIDIFAYHGHLAYKIFGNPILFPFVLSFIGLAIIYLGVLYQKNRGWIERNVLEKLPSSIRSFIERERV